MENGEWRMENENEGLGLRERSNQQWAVLWKVESGELRDESWR